MRIWSKIVLLFALVSVLGITPKLFAAPSCVCQLQWNASSSPDIAGYEIYYGVSGTAVTNTVNVGPSLSYTVTGLAPSTTYFFYVVDYDAYGDVSPPSNVLLFTTPPISPLQITQPANGVLNIQLLVSPGAACEVEYTPTLNPTAWTVLANAVGNSSGLVSITQPMNGPQGFFRGVVPAQLPAQVAAGFSYTLQWAPDINLGSLGYVVNYVAAGSSITNQVNVGQGLSTTITGLLPSTKYVFSVSSIDLLGVLSIPLETVAYTTPPISPVRLSVSKGFKTIQFQVSPGAACHLEYATTLNPAYWRILTNIVAGPNGLVTVVDPPNGKRFRFYRASVP